MAEPVMWPRFRFADAGGTLAGGTIGGDRPTRPAAKPQTQPSERPQFHVWLPGSHPSERVRDSNNGSPGELIAGRQIPGGGPDAPPLYAEKDPDEGPKAPTSGGVTAPFGEGETGSPTYVDADSLMVTGRDQAGRAWSAAIYGGANPQAPDWVGVMPALTSDSHRDREALGRYQRLLNRHYSTKR